MNYIYDIYLNFNKQLYDFFDWNKTDKLTHIKKIPIFIINEYDFNQISKYNIKLEKNIFKYIENKTTISNKNNKDKNFALFSDKNNIIAVEFNNKAESIKKSYLFITEELDILESAVNFKVDKINYNILNKTPLFLKTRKQIKEEIFIKNELKNIDQKKLKYIFLEFFNKYEFDNNIIKKKLLTMSKNKKNYKKLYNILKLTSTSNK